MKQRWIIALLSLFIALVPFLGLPGLWKTFLIVVSALIIAGLSLAVIMKKRAGTSVFGRRMGLGSSTSRGTGNVEEGGTHF